MNKIILKDAIRSMRDFLLIVGLGLAIYFMLMA